MLVAVSADGQYIHAHHAENSQHYRCPACGRPVILKRGRYKTAHFSHQKTQDCYKAAGESAAHLAGKHRLYELFRHHQVKMEYFISDIEQIPDILVGNIVFELQLSVVSVDMILHRTHGYRSIGKEVYWIADEQTLTSRLTAFQRALVHESNVLLSYDVDEDQFFIYYIIGIDKQLNLIWQREVFCSLDQLKKDIYPVRQSYMLSRTAKENYIRQCRSKKSVLEPTLSALYQLNINAAKLPDSIGIVVPQQFYIRTHPIAWQVQLRYMLSNEEFNIADWTAFLQFHHYNFRHYSREEIAMQLINEYKDALNSNCVQI